MTLSQSLIVLLLFGLSVTGATSLCVLSETRCVCDVMVTRNPEHLNCFLASELELRDGKLYVSDINTFLHKTLFQFIQMDKLIFNNITISSSLISKSQLNLTPEVLHLNIPVASTIKSLVLTDVTVDPFLLHPSFQFLHHWLFGPLKSLAIVRSGLVDIDCNWARRVENLVQLDLSENPVSFSRLHNISHCPSLTFKHLKSIRLRRSNLTSLQSLCALLSLTPALTELDVSSNNFSIVPYPQCRQLKRLRMLNLSHSGITEIDLLLSTSLEELDLSHNSLVVFNNPPQTLKKLQLSDNHLMRLPSLDNLPLLQELKVDGNQLSILINETGGSLSTLKQLDILFAGRNPYQCDCALTETLTFLEDADSVFVEDFPEEFLCASPLDQQGTRIMDFSPETCMKPTGGTECYSSPLRLGLFVGLILCLINFFC